MVDLKRRIEFGDAREERLKWKKDERDVYVVFVREDSRGLENVIAIASLIFGCAFWVGVGWLVLWALGVFG